MSFHDLPRQVRLSDVFDTMDASHNNLLSRAEFVQSMVQRLGFGGPVRP